MVRAHDHDRCHSKITRNETKEWQNVSEWGSSISRGDPTRATTEEEIKTVEFKSCLLCVAEYRTNYAFCFASSLLTAPRVASTAVRKPDVCLVPAIVSTRLTAA